jgi:hypothetical protein
MSDELRPCPFCGSEAIYCNKDGYSISSPRGKPFFIDYATCDDIECMGESIAFKVDKWNTRPIEDALRKQLDAVNHVLVACMMFLQEESDQHNAKAREFLDNLTNENINKECDDIREQLDGRGEMSDDVREQLDGRGK